MHPYLGEIRMFSFGYAPRDWAMCDGQICQVAQNRPLAGLLGKTYGGDGVTTFGLPDLRGAAAVNPGDGFVRGGRGGEPTHLLAEVETPTGPGHHHLLQGSAERADTAVAAGKVFATAAGANVYTALDPTRRVTLADATVERVGGVPHENMAPYVAVSFCIALFGLQPIKP